MPFPISPGSTSRRRHRPPNTYVQIPTSLVFGRSALTLNGLAGTTDTSVARVLDQFSNPMNPQTGSVVYSTADASIATVDSVTGLLTSVAVGDVTITASWFA